MKLGQRAIVMGASISGLLVAERLTDHFETVTIFERDPLDATTTDRRGIPQGHHAHLLMVRAQQEMSLRFPDFLERLDAAGAVSVDWLKDVRMYIHGWLPRHASGITTHTLSRPRLERVIRDMALTRPNLVIESGWSVKELILDAGRVRVEGVRLRSKGDGQESRLESADLVVDATGRGSRTPQFLAANGYPDVPVTSLDCHLTYASRTYHELGYKPDWQMLTMSPKSPSHPHSAVLTRQEDGWLLTSSGYGKAATPPSLPGPFQEWLSHLIQPDLADVIRDAVPSSDIVINRSTSDVRHHYERLPSFPTHLLIVGDAQCAFNPSYGQGMTVAALEAAAIARWLEQVKNLDHVGLELQRELSKLVDVPWLLATGADRQWPYETNVERRTNPIERLAQGYIARIPRVMQRNPDVARSFFRVMNMLDKPSALFHPRLVRQVLIG